MIAARSEQLIRALRLTSIGALGVAVLAVLWRPGLMSSLPESEIASDTVMFATPQPSAGEAKQIVANNVFAASRRAPGRRYAPATDASAAPDAAGGDPGIAFDPALSVDSPSLMGTVIDALGARALLVAPAVDSLPKFYSVGERIGTYRVRRIEAGRVTLDGPNGRIVLQLKPNEARP
ncbi:MAG: hypothetical protein ACRENH_13595 [Gemmatimonadaceae bacterium]